MGQESRELAVSKFMPSFRRISRCQTKIRVYVRTGLVILLAAGLTIGHREKSRPWSPHLPPPRPSPHTNPIRLRSSVYCSQLPAQPHLIRELVPKDPNRPCADAPFLKCILRVMGTCPSTRHLKWNYSARNPRILALGRSLRASHLRLSYYDWKNWLFLGHMVHLGLKSRPGFLMEEFSTMTCCFMLHHSEKWGARLHDCLWLYTAHLHTPWSRRQSMHCYIHAPGLLYLDHIVDEHC